MIGAPLRHVQDRTGADRRRAAFRDWRRSRPFWAAVWSALAGVEILSLPVAPPDLVVHEGVAGASGLLIGAALALLGVVLCAAPHRRTAAGTAVLLLTLAALVLSNLGGYLVGFALGVLGGAMALGWAPGELAPAGSAVSAGADGGRPAPRRRLPHRLRPGRGGSPRPAPAAPGSRANRTLAVAALPVAALLSNGLHPGAVPSRSTAPSVVPSVVPLGLSGGPGGAGGLSACSVLRSLLETAAPAAAAPTAPAAPARRGPAPGPHAHAPAPRPGPATAPTAPAPAAPSLGPSASPAAPPHPAAGGLLGAVTGLLGLHPRTAGSSPPSATTPAPTATTPSAAPAAPARHRPGPAPAGRHHDRPHGPDPGAGYLDLPQVPGAGHLLDALPRRLRVDDGPGASGRCVADPSDRLSPRAARYAGAAAAAQPFRVRTPLLVLTGLTYHGRAAVPTRYGPVRVLVFTAWRADILSLRQTSALLDPSCGRALHPFPGSGSPFTAPSGPLTLPGLGLPGLALPGLGLPGIGTLDTRAPLPWDPCQGLLQVDGGPWRLVTATGHPVVLLSQVLSGNLLGLLPVTFTPDMPPPLPPGLTLPIPIFFTRVTAYNQFLGADLLTVPGLHETAHLL